MRKVTSEKMYGDGSLVYGMAAWRPAGATEKQVLCTSYFFSARLDSKGRLQKYFTRAGHQAGICEVPSRFDYAGQFAIRCDIPWVGPVPLEWWGDKTDRPVAKCSVPNGPLVHFEIDDFDADGRVEALLASEEGVGLYGRTEPVVKWQHSTDAPCVGVAAIRNPPMVVYGRQDGWVFAVGMNGSGVQQVLFDKPLQCLTALDTASGPVVLAATRTELVCLQLDGLSQLWLQSGSYTRLESYIVKGRSVSWRSSPTARWNHSASKRGLADRRLLHGSWVTSRDTCNFNCMHHPHRLRLLPRAHPAVDQQHVPVDV